jgi:hypothetical protein
MTLYSDYSATPADNNSPPPVGAPEGMYPSSVNDTMREMMSVIRQLGDQVGTTFAGLGTMATQNADSVAITGGSVTATLAGNGSNISGLNAGALTTGTVPQQALSGTYHISVDHAADADTLGGVSLSSILPLGAIIMYMGDVTKVDSTRWAICDGTRGTPNLAGRYPVAINAASNMIASGGVIGATDPAGTHTHGGNTLGHALTIDELPPHTHNTAITNWDQGGGNHGYIGPGTGNAGQQQWLSDPTGNGWTHLHGISSDGLHQHTVPWIEPPSFGLWFLMRVA